MAEGHPPAAAMAIRASYRRSRLPFARPQTLQTLQRSAQLRREKVPQQAQHAPLPHAKATTRPQQWLKGTPRPHSWLAPPTASAGQTQPTISPAHPRKIPRLRSKWSAAATGIPMHSGKTPYKDPQSWSWRCSHVNFSFPPIRGVGGTWALAHFIIIYGMIV